MNEVTTLGNNKSKDITITYSMFFTAAALYLTIPAIIMLLTWLKILIALPAALLLAASAFLAINSSKAVVNEKKFTVSKKTVVIMAFVTLFLTILFGVGEFVNTMDDHAYRRAMLRDLIDYEWPLYYDLTKQSNPAIAAYLPDCKVAFAYYLTYWMVPALIGKVAGFAAGNIATVIWSAFGILLVLTGLCLYSEKSTGASIFALICFSGLDAIPYFYHIATNTDTWLEGWTEHISYISNINDLLNTYNQCIPCWIITALLVMLPNNRHIGFLGALMFTYSPWATIGILPLAVYKLLSKDRKLSYIFSLGNIIPTAVILLTYGPMYMANTSSVSISGSTISFYGGIVPFAAAYILVLLVEVVPFAVLFFKGYKKSGLYWVSIAVLLVLPFYKVSFYNDLTMRASMPALFVFCLMLTKMLSDFFEANFKKGNFVGRANIKMIAVTLMLLVMSFVAFQQLLLVTVNTLDKDAPDPKEGIGSFGDINDSDYAEQVNGNFFVYGYEDAFFYKYMARK